LEAALQASERGHDVSLYERDREIGGNLRIGSRQPFKKEHRDLLDHYRRRLERSSVRFIPAHELKADEILEKGADVVVLAVGSTEAVPDIPGFDGPGVTTARGFLQDDRLRTEGKGRTAVVGAGLVGCELAWYLSQLGREVYLLDILPHEQWLVDEHATNRFTLIENLSQGGVHMLDDAKVLGIDGDFRMSLLRDGVEYRLPLETVVVSTGFQRNDRLAIELRERKGSSPEIREIGDCAEVRDIHWAIREGYEVGTTI
jgi:2,4-dienoyl-CoA reductase (NADPH2)